MLDIDVFIEKTKKKSRLIGIDPGGKRIGTVSYTHLTLPTNREV